MNFKQWLLYEERLFNEDFKTQREKFIQQGNEPRIVDTYLSNFKAIKDKKYKQINDPIHGLEHIKDRINVDAYKTFHELEILVDYVKGQIDVSGKTSYKNIKVDAKPIHEDNDFIIYYADTPQACVTYKGDVPYGWCIARSDASNMFYTYRFKEHEPAFYFVKNKERTNKEFETFKGGNFIDKYHFFVIQVMKNANVQNKDQKQYIVTSAINDGDKEMSWNEILKLEPLLTNKQNIFASKPLEDKEKELYKRFIKGISDAEFAKLPFDEKDMYLNIYVRQNRPITDNQFKNLPPDLKNKYIGFGVGLSNEQVKMIDSKLNTRYEDVTKNKIKKTIGTEDEISLKPSEADIFLKYAKEFDLDLLTDENIAGIYASGSFNVIRYLIDEGVKVINSKSVQNAADSGNLDLVKYLLGDEVLDEQGNVHKLSERKKASIGEPAVSNAAENGHLEMVKYLVEKGGKIDSGAVGFATRNGHSNIVKYLLGDEIRDEKGNVYKLPEGKNKGSIGGSAVQYAALRGDFNMVKYLVEKGGTIQGDTIQYVAQKGRIDIASYLVEKGGFINNYAVEFAATAGMFDMVKYLLGDEVRDEQGNVYKLPKGTRLGNISDNSVRNAKSEEIKDYLIKSRQEQEMAAFRNF